MEQFGAQGFQPVHYAPPANKKSFLKRTFDMSFNSYITPSIAKFIYTIFIILICLGGVIALIMGLTAATENDLGFIVLFLVFFPGIPLAFFLIVMVRSFLEFRIATVKTAEHIARLRELKEQEIIMR